MKKRLATSQDLDMIWDLILDGKSQMQLTGVSQWTDDYPNKEVISKDFLEQRLWLYENVNACITSYKKGTTQYLERLVVHSNQKGQGIGRKVLMDMIESCKINPVLQTVHIETHEKNSSMIHLLTSCQFKYKYSFTKENRKTGGQFHCYELSMSDIR